MEIFTSTETKVTKLFRFFNDKIENIPNLNLGKFDFIESTG